MNINKKDSFNSWNSCSKKSRDQEKFVLFERFVFKKKYISVQINLVFKVFQIKDKRK